MENYDGEKQNHISFSMLPGKKKQVLSALPFLSLCWFNFSSKEYNTSEFLDVPTYGSQDLFFMYRKTPIWP